MARKKRKAWPILPAGRGLRADRSCIHLESGVADESRGGEWGKECGMERPNRKEVVSRGLGDRQPDKADSYVAWWTG